MIDLQRSQETGRSRDKTSIQKSIQSIFDEDSETANFREGTLPPSQPTESKVASKKKVVMPLSPTGNGRQAIVLGFGSLEIPEEQSGPRFKEAIIPPALAKRRLSKYQLMNF